MDDQKLEQTKSLFKEGFAAVYSEGVFDAMADKVETDGSVAPGVSQLVSKVIDSIIKDANVRDVEVLFGVAIMLIGDILESLQEQGTEAPEGSVEEIINKTMQQVLGDNPSIATEIQQNPEIQAMMQGVGGPAGAAEVIPEAAAAGGPVAQGVMAGVENSKGEV